MADLTAVPAQVNLVDPEFAEVYSFIASVAINAGQPVYMLAASGKLALADANGTAPAPQFKGLALQTVGAGQAVDVLKRGRVPASSLGAGALGYGAKVYVSDTVGVLGDSAGTTTVTVGQVVAMSDSDATKCVYVEANWAAGY